MEIGKVYARKLRMVLAEEPTKKEQKRILALDGGGVRGIFTIEILAKIESLLRQHYQKPDLVLAEHFQFMAGTSTGAIIATLLSWGKPVADIRDLYLERCKEIFPKRSPWKIWKLPNFIGALYGSEALASFLKNYFVDDETGQPALLGTKNLKTTLLICMRNATTGSAWPVTNHPRAKYNQTDHADCNLKIPLWQLVRASTAAPIYFRPEEIKLDQSAFAFVDGGVTSYNNPALIAFLMATQPCYRMEWPTGPDRLLVVSVGTGRIRSVLKSLSLFASNIGSDLLQVPSGLMENISLQQDFLCRVIGQCRYGDEIDSEVGDLVAEHSGSQSRDKKFSYIRYDHRFSTDELVSVFKTHGALTLNNLRTMPFLAELGATYAEKYVKLEHFK